MVEPSATRDSSSQLDVHNRRARRVQLALASVVGCLVLAWLIGGAVIFVQKQSAAAAKRNETRTAKVKEFVAELEWMKGFYFDWEVALGEN